MIKKKKLKFIIKIKKEKNFLKNPDVLSVTQNGVIKKNIVSGKGQHSLDYSKYQSVDTGDFVMNHMDLLTGYIDISKFNGVTSPDYRVFKIVDKDFNPPFLLKIMQLAYEFKTFFGLGHGVSLKGRWRLGELNFLNYEVPHYTLTQQNNILDKILKLEEKYLPLIKYSKKQIFLMQEITQSKVDAIFEKLISGIEKKNYIKLKFISNIINGNSLNSEEKKEYSSFSEDSYSYISTENIEKESHIINLNGKFKIPKRIKKFNIAKANTILLCNEGGSFGKKYGITTKDVCFVNKLSNIETQINPKYLMYYMRSNFFKNQFFSRRTGLISGISNYQIGEIKIPVFSETIHKNIINQIEPFFNNEIKLNKLITLQAHKSSEYLYSLIHNLIYDHSINA